MKLTCVDSPVHASRAASRRVSPWPAAQAGPLYDRRISATTVDGKKVSLSSYKGQSVWLTFGASWCGACQAEAPDVQTAYEKFKAQGVAVLAVSIQEDSATVLDYGKRLGLTYPQIADANDTIASAYRVNGIPAHFFIDKSGILRLMKTGALSPDQMDAALKEINR